MAFDNRFIDELKTKVNIVDVIGREVELKKAGSSYKGLCPFHNEKTPSFSVNEEHQYYHCFGCGEKGDVIRYIQQRNNLTFMEAVEQLCEDYNIAMPERSSGPRIDYNRYYEINRMAARFFFKQLAVPKNPGYRYLRARGLTDDTIKTFGLGYAPGTGHALQNYLQEHGVQDAEMEFLGLIDRGNHGYYDKFRNRVMFPIINTMGKVIGFGGRVLGDGVPKYLNSKESAIFLKKNNLFALNTTKSDISTENQVLLVEGYMDVISLYQHGVRNVAASLGTALTENQVRLISRYSKNIILSYDSDNAGVNAAIRGIDIVRNAGCNVKILRVKGGKDPDEFIRNNGKNAFLELIHDAVPATEFRLDVMKRGYDLTDDEQVIDYIRQCVPILQQLRPVERNVYIKRLSSDFGLSEYAIQSEIRSEDSTIDVHVPNRVRRNERRTSGANIQQRLEDSFVILLLTNNEYLSRMKKDGIELKTAIGAKSFRALQDIAKRPVRHSMEVDASLLFEILDPEEEAHIRRAMESVRVGPDDELFYRECHSKYMLNYYNELKIEIENELSLAEKIHNDDEIDRLGAQLNQLNQTIRKLRGN